MSSSEVPIPAGSQTVGPYFRIGLEYLLERTPALTLETPGTVEVCGQVFDRDGLPVPDAMLEFWSAAGAEDKGRCFPSGFRRTVTDGDGRYSVVMERRITVPPEDGSAHAPHLLVLVFARGLMRHLLSRVYLLEERANQGDLVLAAVPEDRRRTLIAQRDESRANVYRWNVILQGAEETVFFAW